MKVLVCDPIAEGAIKKMEENGHEVTVKTGMSVEELNAEIPAFEAMIVRSATKVRQPTIDLAENLKLIMRGGVGIDNIDHEYAREKNILVWNTPAASSSAVAELAIAHMFAVNRHLHRADTSTKAGKWEKKKFKGVELGGKILGVIGLGRIGTEVAKRAKGLGMHTFGYDPFVEECDYCRMVSLDKLLADSDYITLHLPHTKETHHLISTPEFAKMKEGVTLINCARGGVVNEDALAEALEKGIVARAAVDVYEEEPLKKDHPLTKFDNVLLTPHIGASTVEAQDRIGYELVDKLEKFSKGQY
ncbi:MAG: 3-phosphoglycerate dehydrogenase [Candidatus Coatesbacteria bacterium]|nr:3-phosphoglycerate dehydrogenase [Candidatus Coatesbacteria bacterium]